MINIVKKYMPNNQYIGDTYEKKQIFLHHTVSPSAMNTIRWWNQTPERIGTAYIVDRDGTIYEVFPPEQWAYGLGIKGIAPTLEKSSVQIELVSWGGLQSDEKGAYVKLAESKLYIDPKQVIKMDKPYRGFGYFQNYTQKQIEAVVSLIDKLKTDFKIPIQDLRNFWEFNPKVISDNLPGLFSHTTVREDKSDIIPQKELLTALYTLSTPVSVEKKEKK